MSLNCFQFSKVQSLAGHEDWVRGLEFAKDGKECFGCVPTVYMDSVLRSTVQTWWVFN